jgi:hypothetical protein
MENVIEFRQIWTTHNTRHEGGRATHAAKTLDGRVGLFRHSGRSSQRTARQTASLR